MGTLEAVDRARRRKAAIAGGGGAVAAGLIVGLLVVFLDRGPELTDAAAPAPSVESSPSASSSASPSVEPPVPTGASSPTPAPGSPSAPAPTAPPPTSPAPEQLPAQLELSSDSVVIESYASYGSVNLLNTGEAPLTFTVQVPGEAPWLTANPVSGTIPGGGSAPLDLLVDRASMPTQSTAGPTTTTVVVAWDGGEPRVLRVTVQPEQLIEIDPDEPGSEPGTEPGTEPGERRGTDPDGQPTTDPTSGTEIS